MAGSVQVIGARPAEPRHLVSSFAFIERGPGSNSRPDGAPYAEGIASSKHSPMSRIGMPSTARGIWYAESPHNPPTFSHRERMGVTNLSPSCVP